MPQGLPAGLLTLTLARLRASCRVDNESGPGGIPSRRNSFLHGLCENDDHFKRITGKDDAAAQPNQML